MAEQDQSYRKKQAYLVLLVFACLGVAIWGHSAPVAVVAILAACGIPFTPPPWSRKKSLTNTIINLPAEEGRGTPLPFPPRPLYPLGDDLARAGCFLAVARPDSITGWARLRGRQ